MKIADRHQNKLKTNNKTQQNKNKTKKQIKEQGNNKSKPTAPDTKGQYYDNTITGNSDSRTAALGKFGLQVIEQTVQ